LARKILLADDSVTAQNMGRKILADAGYEITAVNNGSAALKKIAELKPDLVILDVYMPGYSGLEVCQRLKDSPETARIPVLLSVGKLEPFKPGEAQRVRADGFIVKPFEASELLSALSKLEDKVVPRSEPSRPGRFARAIAAAEESDRGRNSENGWKSRISFPHEKTETETAEKVAEESSSYNSMNRDLRTVVETADEKAAQRSAKNESSRQQDAPTETSLDMAALAPSGLPKDVTPEEVAAITAAAAQIQLAGALQNEQRSPEFQVESKVTEIAEKESQPNQIAVSGTVESRIEDPVRENAANHVEDSSFDRTPQSQDEPVTMAATAESVATASPAASRWTAVPVGLEGDEATRSLDQEMQKAYSATPAHEAEAVAAPKPASTADAVQAEPSPVAQPETATPSFESTLPAPAAEDTPVEARVEASSIPELADQKPDPAKVAEFMSPVSESEVASLAGLVGLGAEVQEPAPQAETAMVEAQPAPDSETVKTTAAAWASWRETHNASKGSTEVPANESETNKPAPAETALAVAAGAEQSLQEASSAPPNGNPGDVASIVDSVLADLRPKLMAEISRKMAEKK
jgi:CheY-like chemotaxis protein